MLVAGLLSAMRKSHAQSMPQPHMRFVCLQPARPVGAENSRPRQFLMQYSVRSNRYLL